MFSSADGIVALVLLATACRIEESDCEGASSTANGVTGRCLSFAAPTQVGQVQDSLLLEASGLVASRAHPGVFYTHNDSGDTARFFALEASGRPLGEFDLQGATALDWEDVAIGPSRSGGDVLYFADIGDNSLTDSTVAPRGEIQIVRVREPDVSSGQGRVQQNVADWERIRFTYPDRPHDAETLIADPAGDRLWILTKESSGRASVFSAPAGAPAESLTVLEKLGELELGSCGDTRITSGDISGDGQLVLVRTYGSVLLWARPAGTSFMDALLPSPRRLLTPNELQGEAIAFSADAREWFTLGEGAFAPIFRAAVNCP